MADEEPNTADATATDGATPTNGAGTAGDQQQRTLNILSQYTKDLSFEAPHAPGIFAKMSGKSPDISVNVDVGASKLQENAYEVVLKVNAQCQIEDTVAFVLELVYGCVVRAELPEQHLKPALLVNCPNLMFPFARNIVSDVTRDAGFPPLMLQPMDFAAMYPKS